MTWARRVLSLFVIGPFHNELGVIRHFQRAGDNRDCNCVPPVGKSGHPLPWAQPLARENPAPETRSPIVSCHDQGSTPCGRDFFPAGRFPHRYQTMRIPPPCGSIKSGAGADTRNSGDKTSLCQHIGHSPKRFTSRHALPAPCLRDTRHGLPRVTCRLEMGCSGFRQILRPRCVRL